MKKSNITTYFAIFLVLTAILLRVARHYGLINLPPNFAPISAIALFSGTYLSKKYSLIIPVIAMLIADIFIGFYTPSIMLSVYLSFEIIGILGLYIKNNKTISNIIGGTLLASVLFYLITNYSVWAFSGLYPQNFSGLIECYIMAIPFFKNSLASNIFYVSIMFGSYELVKYLIKNKNLNLNKLKTN